MFRPAIVAAMLAATPAWAQSSPTPIADPRQLTSGSFESVGEVDRFTVQLKEAKDYALEVLTGDDCSTWTVRAPGGAVVRRLELGCEDESWGFEFRTGKAGTYTLEGRADSLESDTAGYQWRIVTDCRADAKTKCSIRPGQTQGHGLAYGLERDWIKLAGLTTGRRYLLALQGEFAIMAVVNGQGQVKAIMSGSGQIAFKAPSATWYVFIENVDDSESGHTYQLSLKAQ
jgi:hypothetical protein